RYNVGSSLCEHASAAVDPTGRLFRPDLIRPVTRFGMSENNPAFTELLTTNAFVGIYFPSRTLLVVETSFTPTGGNPTTMWSDTVGGTDSTDYNLQTGSNLIGNGASKVQIGFISMGDYYLSQDIRVNGSSMVTTSLTVPAEYSVTPGGSYITEMSALELLNSSGATISSGISIDIEERLYHKTAGLISSETWTIQVTTPLVSGTTALPIANLYTQKNTIAGCAFDIQLTAPYTTITRTSAENVMSYYDESCGSLFSTEQGVAMQLDIASRGLSTLYPAPTSTLITAQATTNYPTANVITPSNIVDFLWNPVSGATSYHVYVYQVNSLGIPLINGDRLDFMTINPSLSTALKPSTLYAWEVSPLNATSFCDPNTKSTTVPFETGLSVSVTSLMLQKATFKIHPNPISKNKILTLELTSEGISEAQVSIFNALGQEVMFGQTLELVDGLNKNQLDVRSLSAGLYLIHVQTKEGIQSKKLVVE
ncbi:MAG: T9SS type A sorting domain-containing protein, partial [Aureispira sp.]|nr:T9SS type A sorting domain-containing protein [Aureispira sp.]